MKRNVLLVNPYIYDFAAYDLWARPLGILLISEALRRCGYNVSLIDCLHPENRSLKKYIELGKIKKPKRFDDGRGKFLREIVERPLQLKGVLENRHYCRYGISPAMFEEELKEIEKPDVILITSIMTYWYLSAFEIISFLKKFFKDVPVILGGNYVNLCYEHAKKFSPADIVFRGSDIGEIVQLVDSITENISEDAWLKKILYPACDLLPAFRDVPIITSFGCPFNCSYCASHFLFPYFTQINYNAIFDEIIYFNEKFGVRDFVFFDDALLINSEKHIKPLLRKIIDKKLNIRFHTPNGLHGKYIDKEIANLMFESGFKTIKLGLETLAENLQKQRSNNKIRTDEILNSLELLLNAGFNADAIGVYLIAGIAGQEVEDIIKAIEILKPYRVKIHINEFVPIPMTPDFEIIAKDCPLNIREEPLYHNSTLLCERSKIFNNEIMRDLKKLANYGE